MDWLIQHVYLQKGIPVYQCVCMCVRPCMPHWCTCIQNICIHPSWTCIADILLYYFHYNSYSIIHHYTSCIHNVICYKCSMHCTLITASGPCTKDNVMQLAYIFYMVTCMPVVFRFQFGIEAWEGSFPRSAATGVPGVRDYRTYNFYSASFVCMYAHVRMQGCMGGVHNTPNNTQRCTYEKYWH